MLFLPRIWRQWLPKLSRRAGVVWGSIYWSWAQSQTFSSVCQALSTISQIRRKVKLHCCRAGAQLFLEVSVTFLGRKTVDDFPFCVCKIWRSSHEIVIGQHWALWVPLLHQNRYSLVGLAPNSGSGLRQIPEQPPVQLHIEVNLYPHPLLT